MKRIVVMTGSFNPVTKHHRRRLFVYIMEKH